MSSYRSPHLTPPPLGHVLSLYLTRTSYVNITLHPQLTHCLLHGVWRLPTSLIVTVVIRIGLALQHHKLQHPDFTRDV